MSVPPHLADETPELADTALVVDLWRDRGKGRDKNQISFTT